MLISEEYIKQNAALHDERLEYGSYGAKYCEQLVKTMKEYGCETSLDYGCGKGTLVKVLPGCTGYDPAVLKYSKRPEGQYDMVICTDVLEHIEPDCLDNVLDDIRKYTGKLAFLVACCRPAIKNLPDGRNAHLIIQPQDWWLNKMHEYFSSHGWFCTKDEIVFLGAPLKERREVKKLLTSKDTFSEYGTPSFSKPTTVFISAQESVEHIQSSCARGLEDTEIHEPHDRTLALCGYAPSLHDYLNDLSKETADVATTSGSHDVLIDYGIIPAYHMEADAHKHKALFMTKPRDDIHYYLASRCHPDCFDNVLAKTKDVHIWHLFHSKEENDEVKKTYPKALFIQGAVSIMGRSMCLGMVLGYRRFNIYGMDCSFPWDESKPPGEQLQHAGKHPNPQDVFRTDPINGTAFYTTLQLITTCDQFITVMRRAHGCQFTIRGKGMLATKVSLLKSDRILAPDV